MISQQATHAAVWANRIDLFINLIKADITRWHQGAGWAGLHTFAATYTRARAHVVAQIKHNLRMRTAKSEPNDVVVLLVSTGSHTACALNTAFEFDCNGGVGHIFHRLATSAEAAVLYLIVIAPMVEL